MIPYIIALSWAVFLFSLLRPRNIQIAEFDGRQRVGPFFILAIFASAPLILLYAFRYEVGTDYLSYVEIYNVFSEGASVWWFEPLYSMLNIISSPLGASGIFLVFAAAAALGAVPVYWRILDSSLLPFLSVIVLFGMGYPFLQTNTIRSSVAIAILFFLLPAVWNKTPWRWFLGGALAAGFHYTAILILPFYWVLRLNINLFFAIVFFVFAVLLATQRVILVELLELAPIFLPALYAHYPVRAYESLEGFRFGVGFFWYLFSALFVLFTWRRVGRLGMAERVIRNSFYLGLLIIISLYQLVWLGRIGWFFYIAGVLFWPLIACRVFGEGKTIVVLALAGVHFLLFWYGAWIGAHDAVPYQSIFN